MVREVIFDLETKTFFDEIDTEDPADLGVSVVSLYTRTLDNGYEEKEGELFSFWEDDFDAMWEHFHKADRIIGFNSKRFDVPALRPHAPSGFEGLSHFDILEEIKKVHGKRVSLNAIAKHTLGKSKTGHGSDAIVYWKSGDEESLEKLRKYCEADVLITKDVYDFGLKNKELKFKDYWNTERVVEIDFSYPEDFNPEEKQMDLF